MLCNAIVLMSKGSAFTWPVGVALRTGVGSDGPATWDCATGGAELEDRVEASTLGGNDVKTELIAGTAAIPLPLMMTVMAGAGAPTADVAIRPAVVRVVESIGGGAELDPACAWFGTPEPPATTVTALATVDNVDAVAAAAGMLFMLMV